MLKQSVCRPSPLYACRRAPLRGLAIAVGSARRRGITLVEVMIAVVILTVCCGMLTNTIVATVTHSQVKREQAVAVEAARGVIEDMHNGEFPFLFALYNADPTDDPAGEGTAPGKHFDVPGLDAAVDDLDGLVGEVILTAEAAPMLETTEWEELGLPRDLNGDLEIDDEDHSGDYLVLPVKVLLRWEGRAGIRQFEMSTMLADIRKL